MVVVSICGSSASCAYGRGANVNAIVFKFFCVINVLLKG
jgi:hypothetical protein